MAKVMVIVMNEYYDYIGDYQNCYTNCLGIASTKDEVINIVNRDIAEQADDFFEVFDYSDEPDTYEPHSETTFNQQVVKALEQLFNGEPACKVISVLHTFQLAINYNYVKDTKSGIVDKNPDIIDRQTYSIIVLPE